MYKGYLGGARPNMQVTCAVTLYEIVHPVSHHLVQTNPAHIALDPRFLFWKLSNTYKLNIKCTLLVMSNKHFNKLR